MRIEIANYQDLREDTDEGKKTKKQIRALIKKHKVRRISRFDSASEKREKMTMKLFATTASYYDKDCTLMLMRDYSETGWAFDVLVANGALTLEDAELIALTKKDDIKNAKSKTCNKIKFAHHKEEDIEEGCADKEQWEKGKDLIKDHKIQKLYWCNTDDTEIDRVSEMGQVIAKTAPYCNTDCTILLVYDIEYWDFDVFVANGKLTPHEINDVTTTKMIDYLAEEVFGDIKYLFEKP